MLKLMENDYVFHFSMCEQLHSNMSKAYHEGACDVILKYYAMLLDCTITDARKLMQKRIIGA